MTQTAEESQKPEGTIAATQLLECIVNLQKELSEKDAEIEKLKRHLVEADDFLDELESIWGEQLRYLRRDHSLEALRTLRKQLAEATKPEVDMDSDDNCDHGIMGYQ